MRTFPRRLICSFVFAFLACGTLSVYAQDDPKPKKDAAKTEKLALPDGTAEEQLEALLAILQKGPAERTQEAIADFLKEINPLTKTLADRLLNSKDAKTASVMQISQIRLNLLSAAGRFGDKTASKKVDAFLAKLSKSDRPTIAKFAADQQTVMRIENIGDLKPAERKELVDKLLAAVTPPKIDREAFQHVTTAARMLEYSDDYALAADTYESLAKKLSAADDPRLKQSADRMVGTVRRMRLPGNQMTLKGKTVDGKDFDWASYRGKVVLIDFWATWCGPCIAELPNVLENYEKYHAKGFDVVGISLDNSKTALTEFIAERKLPWANLFDENGPKGFENAIATYYGISGIPATLIVGKDGKVVALSARGPKLGELLEKLLGPTDATGAP
ncbi:MAG: TlpA disulfide reductase family protein [Planctomycetota bacterium]|nr:TlpA disulfide reductase family protein [Planctomycetota bacterium]